MEYMRLQLMEDVYNNGKTSTELTFKQREIIKAVTKSKLQEELYIGLTGRDLFHKENPIFPLREMD